MENITVELMFFWLICLTEKCDFQFQSLSASSTILMFGTRDCSDFLLIAHLGPRSVEQDYVHRCTLRLLKAHESRPTAAFKMSQIELLLSDAAETSTLD